MSAGREVTSGELLRAWLPLWFSWLAMALEFPVIAACVARLANPEIALAAFGGIIVPISFIIESPIIMLLSASTALCRDRASYWKLFRIMMGLGAVLTTVHVIVVLTPLYEFVGGRLLEVPAQVLVAARPGLLLMVPWTWSIAFRRLHQGILIRAGKSSAVGVGTLLRLTVITILGLCALSAGVHSTELVAPAALVSGVIAEAILIGVLSRSVVHDFVFQAPAQANPLTYRRFAVFYYPLLLTSLLDFSVQPVCSAALSRMPNPIESLAVLPIFQGISFVLRSPAFAITELVIANLDRPGGRDLFRRAVLIIALSCTAVACLLAFSPLAQILLGSVLGLSVPLQMAARSALQCSIPLMATAAYKNYFQGMLVAGHRTTLVTWGTVTYMAVLLMALVLGVQQGGWMGITVMAVALTMAALAQVGILAGGVARLENRTIPST